MTEEEYQELISWGVDVTREEVMGEGGQQRRAARKARRKVRRAQRRAKRQARRGNGALISRSPGVPSHHRHCDWRQQRRSQVEGHAVREEGAAVEFAERRRQRLRCLPRVSMPGRPRVDVDLDGGPSPQA